MVVTEPIPGHHFVFTKDGWTQEPGEYYWSTNGGFGGRGYRCCVTHSNDEYAFTSTCGLNVALAREDLEELWSYLDSVELLRGVYRPSIRTVVRQFKLSNDAVTFTATRYWQCRLTWEQITDILNGWLLAICPARTLRATLMEEYILVEEED